MLRLLRGLTITWPTVAACAIACATFLALVLVGKLSADVAAGALSTLLLGASMRQLAYRKRPANAELDAELKAFLDSEPPSGGKP